MDNIIKEEFDDRQADIDILIDLVELFGKGEKIIVKDDEDDVIDSFSIEDQLVNVLKSVIFIMSYNQVESTLRGCLESVYDDFEDNEICYDQLLDSIQTEILNGLLKTYDSGKTLRNSVRNQLSLKAPKASLRIKKVFSGNVTRDTITKIKKDYGLRIDAPPEARDGQDLTTLKDARNDLAHGNYSFSKFGRSNSLQDSIQISKRTSAYLNATISHFADYVDNQRYLYAANDE